MIRPIPAQRLRPQRLRYLRSGNTPSVRVEQQALKASAQGGGSAGRTDPMRASGRSRGEPTSPTGTSAVLAAWAHITHAQHKVLAPQALLLPWSAAREDRVVAT